MNLGTMLILGLKHLVYGDKRIARYVLQDDIASEKAALIKQTQDLKATVKALRAELARERMIKTHHEFRIVKKEPVEDAIAEAAS